MTRKCEPFYFSSIIPKQEGTTPINIALEITNYRGDLDFTSMTSGLETVSNRKNTVTYYARNLSKTSIKFRPVLRFTPEKLEKYLIRYECLCFHEYKLKPGESIELKMVFEIDDKIDDDPLFKEDTMLKIRYDVK